MAEPNKPASQRIRREERAAMLRERQTATGLLTHAREFHKASVLIAEQIGVNYRGALKDSGYHNPFYYLCGHSLELSMKALLLAAGISHDDLMNIGHKLIGCLDAIKRRYPSYVATFDEHQEIINLLDLSYASKEFEYRITGYKSWPAVDPLLYVVEEFCLAAEKILKGAIRK